MRTIRVWPLSLLLAAVLAPIELAEAESWSRASIAALPDSAFAAIEAAPDGPKLRHLPHHDETGAVDRAHLRAATARLGQVRWLDPASETAARRHLEEHRKALGLAQLPRSDERSAVIPRSYARVASL